MFKLPISSRQAAGEALAERLGNLAGRGDVLVLALPRGGVPVAFEIADRLHARLDILLVRKLGVPSQPELAMGAIASGNVRVMNEDVVSGYRIDAEAIEKVATRERAELERRSQVYRGHRPWPTLREKTIVLVDDGIATGATMAAAIEAVRKQGAARIIVAVPVAPEDTIDRLSESADQIVCLASPAPFYAIGQWYQRFEQLSDDEVSRLLGHAWRTTPESATQE